MLVGINCQREGKISIVFSLSDCVLISPPRPINKFIYKCDRKFHLDDLIKLYETYENYAVVLISGKRTEFYLYNINQTIFLKGYDIELPNQHKTGGSSAARFGRIRDEKINRYSKKILEFMVNFYVKNGKFDYRGLIIAGPAEIKNLVKEQELFVQFFNKYLLKILTINEITKTSIYQVISKSAEILTSESNEKNLIDKFEEILINPNSTDSIIFGTNEVLSEFKLGHLKEIFISNKYNKKEEILEINNKTKINIIKSTDFTKKYGELVGIKYFVNDYDNNYETDYDNK